MSGKTSSHGLDLFLEKGHMSVELHYNVYPKCMYNNILHRFCSLVCCSVVWGSVPSKCGTPGELYRKGRESSTLCK